MNKESHYGHRAERGDAQKRRDEARLGENGDSAGKCRDEARTGSRRRSGEMRRERGLGGEAER